MFICGQETENKYNLKIKQNKYLLDKAIIIAVAKNLVQSIKFISLYSKFILQSINS